MSQQDTSLDGSISPSSSQSEDPPEWFIKGRHCHHLGHLEAIPINLGGTLQLVLIADVGYNDTQWCVFTNNAYGPKYDICFKLSGPGNNWIAQTVVGSGSSEELFQLVQTSEPKGSTYRYHIHVTLTHGVRVTESYIFESYLEGEDRERVPEGPEMIPTLQERLGFDTCEI
ncbi:hypothetical protein NW768_004103 [Fusarium equiseti]|uniref:Uncharacterized protein n=1 Tax=Fusarium equiseti TaxID=61235 RepID=A0ABQ8RJL2_FUSEQ|nr:hypothetical protein NW768_004103 [Fusarium equiseti]